MNRSIKNILLILILLSAFNTSAQQEFRPLSGADSNQVYFFHPGYIDSSLVWNHQWLDTAFSGVQRYDPVFNQENFYQTTGNIGLAHQSISYSPALLTGFDPGVHSFDQYSLRENKIRYYSSLKPFTELYYSTGSKKEQLFRVIHSHTIKKQLTIGAYFNLINANGRRSFRQKADDINTYFTAWYSTRNKRYSAYAHYYYNRLKCMENGGILVDSVYEQFRQGRNITQFEYGLKEARNTLTENAWQLKQSLNLDFRRTDSLTHQASGLSLGRFTLTTTYKKPRYSYTDEGPGADYYPVTYISADTNITDSLYFKMLENQLTWTSNEFTGRGKPSVLRFFAGVRHDYIEVHEQPQNSYISQLTPHAGFTLRFFNRLLLSASAETVLGEANNGDLKGNAALAYQISQNPNSGTLSLEGTYANSEFPWIARHFYSSYYRWDISFGKQQTIMAALSYQRPRLKATLQWVSLKNFLYWDNYSRPCQYLDPAIHVFSGFVNKTFVFGKFSIDNKAIVQYSTNSNILHLPLFAATQSYYITFSMFKKALGVQAGIDLWYNTAYYADAWNPATRQFFLQYHKKTGNYLFADVFLNLKIKRAVLFLKLDHANAGLMGYDYYSTPHYPFADRAFKFGINWLFHD